MEPGPAPGTLRFSLTTLYGSDFEGGHFSRRGTSAEGQPLSVPLYRHEVSLDYARIELALQYAVSEEWELIARVPWEQKEQLAGIGFIDPASDADRLAMQRNIDVHHRSVTLRGFSDPMLLGRRRWTSGWSLSGGLTIPIGRTIENPYLAGDEGRQHLHIQFGTGTFDPLLEASYSRHVGGRIHAGGSLSGRVPLYENSRGFRAPADATLAAEMVHRTSDRIQFRLEGALYAQGYGEWDGARDENTGLVATSVAGGVTWRVGATSIGADVRLPVSQRTLSEGDAFEQGPTFIVSVGRRLR